jgi:hypothetical protein
MSYTKILKPPPLDDLNVEEPPYNSEHCISQDPELLFPLHTFALQLRSGRLYWNNTPSLICYSYLII